MIRKNPYSTDCESVEDEADNIIAYYTIHHPEYLTDVTVSLLKAYGPAAPARLLRNTLALFLLKATETK